jgi:hypothetical protein
MDDVKLPQFGPQHLHALTRARARVVKDSTNFSDAHAKYNQKGLPEQAAQMMACNTACFEVQSYLKDLIDTIRAEAVTGGAPWMTNTPSEW